MAVAIKELRQIRRDRRSLLILLFIPVFFLFLYGYALNFDIRHVTLAIQDRDQSAESRALAAPSEPHQSELMCWACPRSRQSCQTRQ